MRSYKFECEETIDSPALIYYEDIIEENTYKTIAAAGGAGRLWPHVKSHKMEALVRMQMKKGITRFKCATIAEAEMCARAGARHVLLAYPLTGSFIWRFVRLRRAYRGTEFWAVGDSLTQLSSLGGVVLASAFKEPVLTLADVNLGMNRTGVSLDNAEEFYMRCHKIEGLNLQGFHAYDGHITEEDSGERMQAVFSSSAGLWRVKASLENRGLRADVMVMGGTPTFPYHAGMNGVYLSPGTCFVGDYGYKTKYSDLDFTPGAVVLSRVVSRPGRGLFTLDAGYKAIASDQSMRGVIAELPEAQPVLHSEEHWVWRIEEPACPRIGTAVHIIPAHICPTSALYPGAFVASGGALVNYWEITARNRRITV